MNEVYDELDQSLSESFIHAFRKFLVNHLSIDRWIITSDFNFDSPGAHHDVFAFACYPMGVKGIEDVRDHIAGIIDADFKRTARISRKKREFLIDSQVFCFVILLEKPFKLLRSGESTHDKAKISRELGNLLADLQVNDTRSYPGLQQLHRESQKKNFSVKMLERIIALATIYAFISNRLQRITVVREILWLPDRDNITNYCETAWWELATIGFNDKIREIIPAKIGIIRPSSDVQQGNFDPLIRIADYLAAAFFQMGHEE